MPHFYAHWCSRHLYFITLSTRCVFLCTEFFFFFFIRNRFALLCTQTCFFFFQRGSFFIRDLSWGCLHENHYKFDEKLWICLHAFLGFAGMKFLLQSFFFFFCSIIVSLPYYFIVYSKFIRTQSKRNLYILNGRHCVISLVMANSWPKSNLSEMNKYTLFAENLQICSFIIAFWR